MLGFVVAIAMELAKGKGVFEQISDGGIPLFEHRDGTMPVSFIQKYLMKKLNLASEAEVICYTLLSYTLQDMSLYGIILIFFVSKVDMVSSKQLLDTLESFKIS